MQRRTFLRGGVGIAFAAGSAGCLGGSDSEPPARKAWLFEDISLDGTQLKIDVESNPRVESRKDPTQNAAVFGLLSRPVLPVGTARGAKGGGGRGSGGYGSAPGHHRHGGWAVWHGHHDDDWRENHSDELKKYPASIATMGVAYIGSDAAYERDPPGPGPSDVSFDRTLGTVSEDSTKAVDLTDISPGGDVAEGWYRVGTELVGEDKDLDFGWQSVDFEIDDEINTTIDKAWYVAPQV